MDDETYSARFVPVASLDPATRDGMARLYLDHYDGSNHSIFFGDLANKEEVLLVHAGDELVGFTTMKILERELLGRRIRVIYSGDTIVERKHWGQQALACEWIARMGVIKRERPQLPLFWLLLSKGHRTYRYMQVFGKSFHPHWSEERKDLKALADALALELFPRDYNPETGVVEFGQSRGHLKPEIALPRGKTQKCEGVRFFFERNPGFQRGHELVCLCEIGEHNMKPLTLDLFRGEVHVPQRME
jgi:hypothetical protein